MYFFAHINNGPSNGISLTILSNPFACYPSANFGFLLPQTAQFDLIIIFPFLVFKAFGILLSAFFLHFKQ